MSQSVRSAPVALLVLGCMLLVGIVIFAQFADVIYDQSLSGTANTTADSVIALVWSGLGLAGIAIIVIAAALILRYLGII